MGVGKKKREKWVGNDLLSHAVTRILPSALAGLTAGFGMGPGVPPPLLSPTAFSLIHTSNTHTSELEFSFFSF